MQLLPYVCPFLLICLCCSTVPSSRCQHTGPYLDWFILSIRPRISQSYSVAQFLATNSFNIRLLIIYSASFIGLYVLRHCTTQLGLLSEVLVAHFLATDWWSFLVVEGLFFAQMPPSLFFCSWADSPIRSNAHQERSLQALEPFWQGHLPDRPGHCDRGLRQARRAVSQARSPLTREVPGWGRKWLVPSTDFFRGSLQKVQSCLVQRRHFRHWSSQGSVSKFPQVLMFLIVIMFTLQPTASTRTKVALEWAETAVKIETHKDFKATGCKSFDIPVPKIQICCKLITKFPFQCDWLLALVIRTVWHKSLTTLFKGPLNHQPQPSPLTFWCPESSKVGVFRIHLPAPSTLRAKDDSSLGLPLVPHSHTLCSELQGAQLCRSHNLAG